MKYIITESQQQKMVLELIKNNGWDVASSFVGGHENLFSIIGESKETVVPFLMSYFRNLHIERRGGGLLLMDKGLPLLEIGFVGLNAYDSYMLSRIDDNLSYLYAIYRRDVIKELVKRFPEMYSDKVTVFVDSGRYKALDKFELN